LKVGQAFYVHENVPADRLVALKKAFTDMLNDPKFLEDAKKMGLVIRTRTADQVAKVVNDLYATPRNLISDLDAIFKQ
jgi:tripartite-type tricarboxylate transporter receptor subunit TctC